MGIDVKSSAAAEEQKLPLCNLSLASERTCYLFTRLSDEKHCIALIVTDHAFDFWEAKCPREEEIFAVHVNTRQLIALACSWLLYLKYSVLHLSFNTKMLK